MTSYSCIKCHHIWYPRKPGIPTRCPKCNTLYWNKIQQAICQGCTEHFALVGEYPTNCLACRRDRPTGRPPKYPITDLQVGELRLFPFHRTLEGGNDAARNASMHQSISAAARRAGITLMAASDGQGLTVKRIA